MANPAAAPAIPPFPGHAAATRRPWVMAMTWRSLLFMHWPVDTDTLRATLPPELRPHLDTFDGRAWLGVVPFEMTRTRGRFTPALPGVSRFAELNVRTYLNLGGKPGVWFYSLDAASRLAVRAARRTFHLPYFDATMTCHTTADGVSYASRRTHRDTPPAELAARYRPTAPPQPAEPGSLEHFLTERYCLYARTASGRLMRGDIAHEPWPLQPAACELERCEMTNLLNLGVPGPPPLLHYADRLDVVAWWPVPV